MNESEKIRRIKENMKIKNKLNSIGICGIVGPTVPRGEPNGIGAYAERYSISNQRFNISANREIIIPLEATGPAIFAEYNSSYAIIIKKYVTYQINYFLNVATSVDANYTISIKASGTKLLYSEIRGIGKANIINQVSGTLIFSLTEEDEITFVITSDQDAELIFDGTTVAKLSVIKLD